MSLSTVDFKKVGKSFKNIEFGSTTTSLKKRKESDEAKEERSTKITSKEDNQLHSVLPDVQQACAHCAVSWERSKMCLF